MVKIYLAVTSNTALEAIAETGGYPYLLFSYWYIKQNFKPFKYPRFWKQTLIDSGAHSIQQGAKTNYDAFFEEYFAFLYKHKKEIDYAVELDIEEVVGMTKVEEWRRELETLNIPIIVVWHKHRGWDYWEKMCREYDYVGISGFLKPGVPEIPDRLLPKFFKVAKQYGTKVHGFGYTRFNSPAFAKFYSVDSSSWARFVRWLNNPMFTSFKHKGHIPKFAYRGKLSNKDRYKFGVRYYQELLRRWDKDGGDED